MLAAQYLDLRIGLRNFCCVRNAGVKDEPTEDFEHYCRLRDDPKKAFYIRKGCSRRWMNQTSEERGSAGINILWPHTRNVDYQAALAAAELGENPNMPPRQTCHMLPPGRLGWSRGRGREPGGVTKTSPAHDSIPPAAVRPDDRGRRGPGGKASSQLHDSVGQFGLVNPPSGRRRQQPPRDVSDRIALSRRAPEARWAPSRHSRSAGPRRGTA